MGWPNRVRDGDIEMNNKRQGFIKILTEADFTKTDHQMLTSITEWTTIATYTCPAQQEIHPGSGSPGAEQNQGRVYVFLRTGEGTPVEIKGSWRIVLTDANDIKKQVIQDFDEELTHGDLNDKHKMIPLPYDARGIGEDSKLIIQVKPRATHLGSGAGTDNLGWASSSETLLKIPVTVFI